MKTEENSSKFVRDCILESLDAEKKPKWQWLAISILSALFIFGLWWLASQFLGAHLQGEVVCLHLSLGALFIVGFLLFRYPEPKFSVRGYLGRKAFGKLLIVSSVLGALEFLFCPHLVFTHQNFGGFFSFMNIFVDYSEAKLGPDFCSFICGFIFSTLVSLVSFLFVFKNLSFFKLRPFLLSLGGCSIAFLPIFLIHALDDHLRSQLLWWGSGVLFGITLVGLIFSAAGWLWLTMVKTRVTHAN